MSLCVWPCNCYEPSDKDEPDLMWDLDLYSRLDLADAWAIIGPVSWYGPTSNLKLMFDRLVCMNGGNPREDLIDHKDPEKAIVLENSPEWETLSVNHLEGRTAAFFSYTDEGGVEMDGDGCPKILRHKDYFDPELEPFDDMRQAYAPLVWQCLYGGVEVPDALWASLNQAEDMIREDEILPAFDAWAVHFAAYVAKKGKVEPGRYRAYGYKAPSHRWADLKLKLRELRMRAGLAPSASSPAVQEQLDLNEDEGFPPAERAKAKSSGAS